MTIDTAPEFPLAGLDGSELPPNSCPECAEAGAPPRGFATPAALGAHRKSKHGVAGDPKKQKRKPKGDGPPRIDLNISTGKDGRGRPTKDAQRIQKTAKGATSAAQALAAGLVLFNQPEDAGDIAARAEAFGAAIGDLSQYQEWLSRIFAPGGEMTGEAAAWLAVVLVLAGMSVPIGARHGWVPQKYAEAFGFVAETIVVAAAVAEEGAGDDAPPVA